MRETLHEKIDYWCITIALVAVGAMILTMCFLIPYYFYNCFIDGSCVDCIGWKPE